MREKDIRESLKQFYNNVSNKFSQTRSHFWPGFDFIRKYYKKEGKALDFGCGNGRLVDFLNDEERLDSSVSLGKNYIGVDISEKLIEIAQKKHPDYDFKVVENEAKLPFESDQFDFIFSIAVFHHFNPQMARSSLRELKRVLKKDGIVILSVWYLWRWKYLKYINGCLFGQDDCSSSDGKNTFLSKRSLRFLKWPKIYSFHLKIWQANLPFKDNDRKTHWRYCYFWTLGGLRRLAKKEGFDILEDGFTFDKKGRKRNIYLVLKVI